MGEYYEKKRRVTTCEFCDEPTHKEDKDGYDVELKPRGRLTLDVAGDKLRAFAERTKDSAAADWARSHIKKSGESPDYWLIMMVCQDCFDRPETKALAYKDTCTSCKQRWAMCKCEPDINY